MPRSWFDARTSARSLARGRERGGELADVLVRVTRVIARDMRSVDLAHLVVQAGARAVRDGLQDAHDLAVRGQHALRELHRVTLVVAPLCGDFVLIDGGQVRS